MNKGGLSGGFGTSKPMYYVKPVKQMEEAMKQMVQEK